MGLLPSEDHWSMVDDFNQTYDATTLGHCLHRLVECAADKYRQNTAVICGDTEAAYGDLNSRANLIARVLVARGVKRGDTVGVALDRSVDLVVVLLSVLKTGAAYVPIDPTYPAKRMEYMLNDAAVKLVLVNDNTSNALDFWGGERLNINGKQCHDDADRSNLMIDVDSEDLAYILYTSGSTGQPKGVDISHGAVCNMLLSVQQSPGCEEKDRLLAVSTVSFDMAVPELFLPLICGAATVVAEAHHVRDPGALFQLMRQHRVTIMQGTPTIWQMLVDAGWRGGPRLDKMLSAGEPLPRHLADRLLDCGDQMWNLYGPTEAAVHATAWDVVRGEEIMIGSPIANYRLYVLGEDLTSLPLGATGELYIGGASLARSYHNKPELTRTKFIKNPFHQGLMYRTGDLGRFIAPGKLVLLGRADDQVKIRGHRIELGEVESAITDYEDISRTVVVSRDGRLVAYCVRQPQGASAQASSAKAITDLSPALRPWLAERLPSYMIPAFIIELDNFPVTLNRKIDRKLLPDPVTALQIMDETKPAADIEGQILVIWSDVLGHERIGVNDNFFEIGGDSARVIRVQSRLERVLGRSISPAKLFEHYTIKALSAYLKGAMDKANSGITAQKHPNECVNEPIAIISMACRLPGGVATPDDFWELLDNGNDAIVDVPEGRWDVEEGASGKSYCRKGGFIGSIDSSDTSFFGISPREARELDPMQQVMLETCWEGFERAGYTTQKLRGSRTGVYIGVSNIAAYHGYGRSPADLDGYTGTGTAGSTLSGRLSYVLGLEGPAMTVDAACSSSLVATHLGCNALRQGECDMVVCGGVCLMQTPGLHIEFSRLKGMSPDGRCRAFSENTRGTGWGEGSVAVVLKRLSDAQRDSDTIHAVLRGTAVNHSGRSASLTTPSGPAQQKLIRTALSASGLQPSDIDYIEAHGTGTKLGDPIEGGALAEVFGGSRPRTADPLWVGSAKSNVGHTQAAAGLVGMLKVVLAMKHHMLPRTLHVSEPTRTVDWQGAHMALVQRKRPWLPQGSRMRRAGISAFGISGTNAHVIVEEATEPASASASRCCRVQSKAALPDILPFLLSGHTSRALNQQAEKLRRYLRGRGKADSLGHVAYSLATTRDHFRHRLVLAAKDRIDFLDKLAAIPHCQTDTSKQIEEPRLAMLFTGQGSQLVNMGRGLAKNYPVFGKALKDIAMRFDGTLDKPLLDVMWSDTDEAAMLLKRTDYAQTALFALEVALFRLWESWGMRPEFVLGHSIGELAAAHVAGIMDLPDACRLVAARGKLMQALPEHRGGMASLEANAVEITAAIRLLGIGGQVEIASYNTPTQIVVSGDLDMLQTLAAHFTAQGRKSKMLEVSHAFHSHHMDDVLAAFETVARTVTFHPPKLAVISSVTGKLAGPGQMGGSSYWVQQARKPVRFSDSIQALSDQGVNAFLELGPQPVLCGMGAACLADDSNKNVAWLPSLRRKNDDEIVILDSLTQLHVRHVPVDWEGYFAPFDCQRVELPTYAFQRDGVRPEAGIAAKAINESNDAPILLPRTNSTEEAHRFHFEIQWRHADAGSDHFSLSNSWGLFCPGQKTSWAERVNKALSSLGLQMHDVATLGDAQGLDGLLCLWDSDPEGHVDVVALSRDLATQGLAQLQDAARTTFAPSLVWITRCAIGTGRDDGLGGFGAAPLWGLMRTARNEHPELRLRIIDVGDEQASMDTLASCLTSEAEAECAIRQGEVLVPRLKQIQTDDTNRGFCLRQDGAVLITGGMGGIGQRVARWLVTNYGVRDLVLTSRRGMGAPGSEALVQDLSHLGARVTVVPSNMADASSVKSVAALFGDHRPLRGVIHTAGVIDDGVLSSMTPSRCNTTFDPKLDGAWNLHQLTQNMDLDFFVMFSSVSGIMGTAGQANYAAANVFLDALAYRRRAMGLPATSVAWGLWDGEGMAARLSGTGRASYTQLGLDPLTTDQGLGLLEHAIKGGNPLTVGAAYDLERLRKHYEDGNGIPPLLQSLLGQGSGQQPGPGASQGWDLTRALNKAAPKEQETIVLRIVRQIVSKTLGFASAEDVDIDVPLQAMGMDSLTAVLARNQLAAVTGLALPVGMMLEYPSLRALGQGLLSQFQDGCEESSSETASSSGTPLTSASGAMTPSMEAARKGFLDPSITFNGVKDMPAKHHPESVLVTGATSLIGAFLVHELLHQGISTHCLVPAGNVDSAMHNLVTTLRGFDLWRSDYAPLLHPIVGDSEQPLFGLDEEAFDQLADRIHAIVHSDTLMERMRPLEDYIGPNVVSTHEVLRLASRGQKSKPVHVISTSATLSRHMGYEMDMASAEYGYVTSKWMAEQMVAAARWRGATAAVYRLPLITAPPATGQFWAPRGDFLHNLIIGSIELGSFPSLDGDMPAVLPVDYLCKIITSRVIMDDEPRTSHDYDFMYPHAPSLDSFLKLMCAAAGSSFNTVPLSRWRQRALEYAAASPTSPLANVAATVGSMTSEGATTMFKGSQMGARILEDGEIPIPHISEEFARKYLNSINAAKVTGTRTTNASLSISSNQRKCCLPKADVPTRNRIFSPGLGMNPPNTPEHLFPSALDYFTSLPWCSRLIHVSSPTSGPLPGHGQAVAFISQCFNPASPRQDRFVGRTLSQNQDGNAPPLRHVLSLFRPLDPSHLHDPTRPILRVATLFALGDGTSGFEAMVHGGLIATLVDEGLGVVNELNSALGKRGDFNGKNSVTASLKIDYLAPVSTAETAVCVAAWVEGMEGRKTMIRAEMTNSEGDKLAVAESVWFAVDS